VSRPSISHETTGARSPRSARHSGTRKPPKASLPDPLVYFVDRSLGRFDVANALRAKGAVVVVHDDEFSQNAEDPQWLRLCGERRYLTLTKDERIRFHPLNRRAVLAHRVAVFTLTSANLTGAEMAKRFVDARAQMERIFRREHPPFIAYVPASSRITRILREDDLV
jgi:hypothetical protein